MKPLSFSNIRTGLLLAAVLLIVASPLRAQVLTGNPRMSTTVRVPEGSLDLGNLNVHIPVSIIHKAGRGTSFGYVLSYDSSVWQPVSSSGTQSWQLVSNWGWRGETEAATGYVTYDAYDTTCDVFISGTDRIYSYIEKDNYAYHDALGAVHWFNIDSNNAPSACGITSVTSGTAEDGSGYTLTAAGALTTRTGKVLHPPMQTNSGSATVTDNNGNEITTTDGATFTDTLGTTALAITGAGTASSPMTYTWTNPAAGSSAIVVHYSNFTIQTAFGCSGIAEYNASSVPLVTSIQLPDQTQYSFTYETTPGNASATTGRIASVTLPTGGTIAYAYTGANDGISCQDGSTTGLTRTTPDSPTAWAYSRTASSNTWTTTVTDPPGNQTVLTFQSLYTGNGTMYEYYETQRDVYQGAVTGGTKLESVETCYNGSATSPCGSSPAADITRRTIFTTLPATQQKAERDEQYNGYGLPTEVDEYGFGANNTVGGLLRKTVWTYASLSRIAGAPASIAVYLGNGAIESQTNYSYDQTAVTATAGTPQLTTPPNGSRGNLTTISEVVNGSATLNRTFTYFDTGNVAQATDVNGAITTYTYGACGNSFPTQISEPLPPARAEAWDAGSAGALAVPSRRFRSRGRKHGTAMGPS